MVFPSKHYKLCNRRAKCMKRKLLAEQLQNFEENMMKKHGKKKF